MTNLAAAGDNCIDNYASLGERYAGGNAVNVAVSFARNGGKAAYIGAVGDDEDGAFLLQALGDTGVDVSHVKVLPGRTAVTQVELVNGDRVFGDYDEGVMADFDLDAGDLEFIKDQGLFLSAWWGNLNHRLADVHALGVPVAFDFATEVMHPKADAAIPHVDYAFFSDERDPEDPELRALLESVAARGPKVVVATLGAKGSLSLAGGEFIYCPVIDCEVVDTMGAGDSYIGGFLAGVAKDESIADCMSRATRSAANTIGLAGAW